LIVPLLRSPICAASRASLMSGVYPQQHGSVSSLRGGFLKSVIKEHRFATLPEVLGKAGYHSALIGKSHSDSVIRRRLASLKAARSKM